MTLQRLIHVAQPAGGYRRIPLTLTLRPARKDETPGVTVNGRRVTAAEVASLDGVERLQITVTQRRTAGKATCACQ